MSTSIGCCISLFTYYYLYLWYILKQNDNHLQWYYNYTYIHLLVCLSYLCWRSFLTSLVAFHIFIVLLKAVKWKYFFWWTISHSFYFWSKRLHSACLRWETFSRVFHLKYNVTLPFEIKRISSTIWHIWTKWIEVLHEPRKISLPLIFIFIL